MPGTLARPARSGEAALIADTEDSSATPRPDGLDELLALRAARPELRPIAGGTDVMVDVNFGRTTLLGVLDLTLVDELQGVERDDRSIRVGAACPMWEVVERLPELTALADAAVTIGSPQIRARASLGGNLVTASPAGDCIPALLVHDAELEIASARGARRTTIGDFLLGPGRTTLADDELIVAVHLPRRAWRSRFAKLGVRNAMVISSCSVAVSLDASGAARVAAGAVAPTARRLPRAEAVLEGLAREAGPTIVEPPDAGPLEPHRPSREGLEELERAVRADIAPIDDHRSTAAYRSHATAILVGRCATQVLAAA